MSVILFWFCNDPLRILRCNSSREDKIQTESFSFTSQGGFCLAMPSLPCILGSVWLLHEDRWKGVWGVAASCPSLSSKRIPNWDWSPCCLREKTAFPPASSVAMCVCVLARRERGFQVCVCRKQTQHAGASFCHSAFSFRPAARRGEIAGIPRVTVLHGPTLWIDAECSHGRARSWEFGSLGTLRSHHLNPACLLMNWFMGE